MRKTFWAGIGLALLLLGAAVFLREGGRRQPLFTPAAVLRGTVEDGDFGSSVAAVGDLDRDGHGDLLVGAPGAGAAYVYFGARGLARAPLTLRAPAGAAGFGRSVAGAGDTTRSGYRDLIVGAWGSNAAYVYEGGPHGPGPAPARALRGPRGQFGWSVAGVGDLNRDGGADVAIGAPGLNRVYVYFGGAKGLALRPMVLHGPPGAKGFGWCVAGAPDLEGRGTEAVVVGAPGSHAVYVYRTGSHGLDPTPRVLVGPPGSAFGACVAGVAGVGKGGYGDLVVGAWKTDRAYVYRGGAGGLDPNPVVLQGPPGSAFGASVAGAGGLTADGGGAVMVGATRGDSVSVYFAGAGGIAARPRVLAGPDRPIYDNDFATSLAASGDLIRRGQGGMVVGANGANAAFVYFAGR